MVEDSQHVKIATQVDLQTLSGSQPANIVQRVMINHKKDKQVVLDAVCIHIVMLQEHMLVRYVQVVDTLMQKDRIT